MRHDRHRVRPSRRGERARRELREQPLSAYPKALHRVAHRRHPARGLDAGATAPDEERHDRPPGPNLREGDGTPQRLARRRWRRVGTRPLLARRPAAPGVYPERRGAHREGEAVGGMDLGLAERERLLRTRHRPELRTRTATRQRAGLVAQDGDAESAATIPLRHGRHARHRFLHPLLPLPIGGAPQESIRQVDVLGRAARGRQPDDGLLALQHHGRRLPAGPGRADSSTDVQLDRRLPKPRSPLAPPQPPLREPGAGLQGTRRVLPA